TSGKAASLIFDNDPLFSATLTLNDRTSNTIHLDAPSVVIINRENFLKIADLAKVNESYQTIIDVDDHEAIQADNTNLDRQPSDISLDFVNMDIQGSNAQDMELSFDEDAMVDGQGAKISRINDNSIENDYSVSQPLEKSEIIQKNKDKAQDLNSNNQEQVEFSDKNDDTDEEMGGIDALALSCKKSKEISSAKDSTKSHVNTTKHSDIENERTSIINEE
ncbi:5662_t:CDS:2, partial [Racocetra persica]